MVNIMFQFWKFYDDTYRENAMNWYGIEYYITIMLAHMSLLLFSDISVNEILNSYHIFSDGIDLVPAITGCF